MTGELLIHGLVLGSVIAFVAIGYALVFSVLKFINFAHGEIMTLGAYFCYVLSNRLGIRPFALAVLLAVLLGGCAGVLIERVAYRPLRSRGRLSMLLSSLGVSIIIQALLALAFGSSPLVYGVADPVVVLFGHPLYARELLVVAALAATFAFITAALRGTNVGLAVRAISSNPTRTALLGVPADLVVSVVFFVASALAAAAGISIAVESGLQPTMGFEYTVWAFTAAVIAGLGSVRGILLGGLLLGVLIAFTIAYMSSLLANGVALGLMSLVLLVRPQGLFVLRRREF
jgi:branched-chain amino acid transport system permease protein